MHHIDRLRNPRPCAKCPPAERFRFGRKRSNVVNSGSRSPAPLQRNQRFPRFVPRSSPDFIPLPTSPPYYTRGQSGPGDGGCIAGREDVDAHCRDASCPGVAGRTRRRPFLAREVCRSCRPMAGRGRGPGFHRPDGPVRLAAVGLVRFRRTVRRSRQRGRCRIAGAAPAHARRGARHDRGCGRRIRKPFRRPNASPRRAGTRGA
ncbi:hypothetical protein RHIZO_01101 [Rhizobiaceae bacterium]|nr:hypothetical protein RHIZO_01101 [Rhizobiaceae bacterium]